MNERTPVLQSSSVLRSEHSMRAARVLLIGAFVSQLWGCATAREPAPPPPVVAPERKPEPEAKRHLGTLSASYYGDGFDGKKTASGEPFDSNGFTAAHRTLPFGTVLEVRRPDTSKSVRVRVNDRGPFVKGRDLDLSERAAHALGIGKKGVARVEVHVVERGDGAKSSERGAAQ